MSLQIPASSTILPIRHEHRSLRDIEDCLFPTLEKINSEIKENFSYRKVIYRTLSQFPNDCKNSPLHAIGKIGLTVIALGAMAFLTMGSIACFAGLRLFTMQDLFGDTEIAVDAAQILSALGHGIGYPLEMIEIVFISSVVLFGKSYQAESHRVISDIYDSHIDSIQNIYEKDFLFKQKQNALSWYNPSPMNPSPPPITRKRSTELETKTDSVV